MRNTSFLILMLSLVTGFAYGQSDTSKLVSDTLIKNTEGEKSKTEVTKVPSDTGTTKMEDMGVAVSPASMHVSIKPGTTLVREVTINNDTKKDYKFTIGFNDFEMGVNGKPITVKTSGCKYCLSKNINVSPTFVELKPHEKKKVKIIITIPDEPESYRSSWTIVTVDQAIDRKPLDYNQNDKSLAMGVTNSFGFGVYVYQNPPNVKNNQAVIEKFFMYEDKGKKNLRMNVKNTGDGIGYCMTYVEITNTKTGEQKKIGEKRITILPQFSRELDFELSKNLSPGKYSAVGVLDFGSKDEVVVAQYEFTIK